MTPDTARIRCKSFLATLLRLGRNQPERVAKNMRGLIQELMDGRLEPELFTTKLQKELNSSHTPGLVSFLKKSLPYLLDDHAAATEIRQLLSTGAAQPANLSGKQVLPTKTPKVLLTTKPVAPPPKDQIPLEPAPPLLQEPPRNLTATAQLRQNQQDPGIISQGNNNKQLEEEVQNLRALNENLKKETGSLQRDVKALKRDLALQRENEEMLSSLKNQMAKKLEEKEIFIAEQNGQLKALKNELSQEKERTHSNKEEIVTLDAPFDKKKLEKRISQERKKLASCVREEEKLRGELKQHRINLTMIESGINQLINDPTTPSSLIHSLKLLRHSSMFSLAATKEEGPQEKIIKLEGGVKEEYQEYFEHASVKQDAHPPEFESELDGPKDSGTSVTNLGDDGCGIPEGGNRREPDGPTVMESDGTEVESVSVTNSAGEDVND